MNISIRVLFYFRLFFPMHLFFWFASRRGTMVFVFEVGNNWILFDSFFCFDMFGASKRMALLPVFWREPFLFW